MLEPCVRKKLPFCAMFEIPGEALVAAAGDQSVVLHPGEGDAKEVFLKRRWGKWGAVWCWCCQIDRLATGKHKQCWGH